MKTLARHLLAELYGSSHDALDDLDRVRDALRDGVRAIGATPLGETFHRYAPQGVSGTIVIAESHLSIHTWPESSYAALDILTCGGLDPRPGFEVIGRALGAERVRVQEVLRGLAEEVAEAEPIGPEDIIVLARTTEELPLPPCPETARDEESVR